MFYAFEDSSLLTTCIYVDSFQIFRILSLQVSKGGFLTIGVQTYGSGLWHTWFDRDLTVAGRVLIKRGTDENASFSHKLVRIQDPILRIPTLAIHLDR